MRTMAPAEGERIAASGYGPQYRVAASIILKHLRERTLQWIRVADPEAGRVDDLQIGSPMRVDAYQVKWSSHPDFFAYSTLTSGTKKSPSLINQLVDGWQRLMKTHSASRVVVHLVSNDVPSSNAKQKLPVGSPEPKPKHFSAFIQQAWRPRKMGRRQENGSWDHTWDELRKSTGLDDDQFDHFVSDCELDLGYQIPDSEVSLRNENQQDDIGYLAQFLFNLVGSPERVVELGCKELLDRLGWSGRTELVNPHEFPLSPMYEPISASTDELAQKLADTGGGYILVSGSPGSGKSTLLTHFLRERHQDRIIRYYAFVPDAQDPINLRGESESFLRDMVLMLESAGVGERYIATGLYSHSEFLKRFYRQLSSLGEDWRQNKRKTIILIDGLDHIEREQHPAHSFLSDLPRPNQVPDGVHFILGSQTDQLVGLDSSIRRSVSDKQRRVEMNPLGRDAVYRLVDSAHLALTLTDEQKERVFHISAGHPLALAYVLNQLHTISDSTDLQTALDTEQAFSGDIDSYYDSHWESTKTDSDLVSLLARISRLRRAIDLHWVAKWSEGDSVDRLYEQFARYFRKEAEHRWYFFHNSFRLFLQRKTSERFGSYDPSLGIKVHKELAEICGREPDDSPWSWEVIHHLACAEDHLAVVGQASQVWFQKQLLDLRPIDAIETDIDLAFMSAAKLQDPVALARLSLARAEINLRANHLGDNSVALLLMNIGLFDTAVEYARNGNRLRVDGTEALSMCVSLHQHGLLDEARRVFELAEPLDILKSTATVDFHKLQETRDLLSAWGEAAVLFREVSDVVLNIRQIKREPEPHEKIDSVTASREFQNSILFAIGRALIADERWDDLRDLITAFDNTLPNDCYWRFWLYVHASRKCSAAGDRQLASEFCSLASEEEEVTENSQHARVALAEGVFRVLRDTERAASLVLNLPQPPLHDGLSDSGAGFRLFDYRFRLNRLLSALGHEDALTDVVPDAEKPSDQGMVYFERAVCLVARLWGHRWRRDDVDTTSLIMDCKNIIRVFYRSVRERREWHSWYVAEASRAGLYETMIDAVGLYGEKAIADLRQTFQIEWAQPTLVNQWPVNVIRSIILALYDNGESVEWVSARLTELEKRMLDELDPRERVDECFTQANAWLRIGDQDRALELIHKALRVSVGVGGRKDYQMNTWINWLEMANSAMPDGAADRIAWFARAITTLGGTTEGPAQREASAALVRASYSWSPLAAIGLFNWFTEQKSLRYTDGLDSILTAAIEAPDIPIHFMISLCTQILMPCSTDSHWALVTAILARVADSQGTGETLALAADLLDAIQKYALPSTRKDWRRAVATELHGRSINLETIGLSLEDTKEERQSGSELDLLELKDGSKLSEGEIRSRLTSVADLQLLLNDAVDRTYYRWREILPDYVKLLTLDEINQLDKIIQGSELRSSFVLSAISERLYALGETKRAWEFGEEALARSNKYGWSRWYDGGTRIAAFTALANVDSRRARELMFSTLEADGGGGAENLDKILPLLTDSIPIEEIWNEIESYVHTLFSGVEIPAEGPDVSALVTELRVGEALATFAGLQACHPIGLLSEAGKRILVQTLLSGDAATICVLDCFLSGSELEQEVALAVIETSVIKDQVAPTHFLKPITQLNTSPNYSIRKHATDICSRLGWPLSTVAPSRIQQSSIYDIGIVIERGEISPLDQYQSTKSLPNTDGPVELLRPLDYQIRIISEVTGLPFENLVCRTTQLMRSVSPVSTWDEEAEERLRSTLHSAGLKYPYSRPRSVVATRAVFHLIGELIDTGRLHPSALDEVEPVLRFCDPYSYLSQPAKRPGFVRPITGLSEYSSNKDEWMVSARDAHSTTTDFRVDDLIVLAEHTVLAHLDWERPFERRLSAVAALGTPKPNLLNDPGKLFGRLDHVLTEDYSSAVPATRYQCIIVENSLLWSDSHYTNWLALNPQVGNDLGWQLSSEGLFRWQDRDGRTMVESLWWTDGNVEQMPPHFHNEVGEGWLVVATPEALEQIRRMMDPIRRRLYAVRYLGDRYGWSQGISDYLELTV